MSGWIDFYDISVKCSVCGCILNVPLVENGDINEDPEVVVGICGGSVQCPVCGAVVTDADLKKMEQITEED
jgi:transposase